MDETLLLEKAHTLAARHRRVAALEAAARQALPGAVAALAMVLVLKALGCEGLEAAQGLAPLALFPLGAALRAALAPVDLVRVAYRADLRLDTKERLGSALEWVLSDRPRTVMAAVLVRDAAAAARSADPRRAFPVRWPRSLRPAALLGILAVAVALVPPWALLGPEPPELLAVRRQAEDLSAETRALHRQDPREEVRRLAAEAERLARDLEKRTVDPREAMNRLAALGEDLRRLQADGGLGSEEAGRASGGRSAQEAAARRARDLARQIRQDPQAARKQLESLAADPQAGAAEREAAAAALEALARGAPEEAAETMARCAGQGSGETLAQGQPGGEGVRGNSGSPGTRGQGAGEAAGNPGQATREGQGGQGRADFGRGTTLKSEPADPGSGSPDFVLDRQADRTSDWTEEFRRLHPPRRDRFEMAPASAGGTPGAGRTLPAAGEARGAPSMGGTVSRPAAEVYREARQEAEQAVAREEIPARRREVVRTYFEGIDPRR